MAYRDSTSTKVNGTSIAATKPALLQSGDILLCYLLTDVGLNGPAPTVTPPTGWTLIAGSNQGANTGAPDGWTSFVYWKLASSGEPATYTFSISGTATDLIALIGCWSGRNQNPTFITHGTVNTTGNATPVTVSDTGITALSNDDILIFATGDITVGTDTWSFTADPANYTERQDTQQAFNVGTLATRDGVFSGATGTLSLTLTRATGTGTSGWGIFVISIPANNAISQPTPSFHMKSGMNIKLVRLYSQLPQPPVETITIDKWNSPNENPVRKSLPAAVLATSLFFTPVVTQTEVITVDKWYQPISQPNNKISYRQTGGEFRFEVPRTILISDWFQPASEPVRRKPTQLLGGESRFEVPRTILLSDWFAEIRQPYFSKFRLIPFGESRFEVPRDILVTDWYQPISQPLKQPPRKTDFGEYRFEVPRTILLSDWYQSVVQPQQKLRQLNIGGETRTDVVTGGEIVTLDKWHQPINQPFFSTKRNSNFGEYRFEVPRDILLSDWFNDTSQPVKDRLRQLLGGESRVDIIIPAEVVTLDKWYQETQQPYLRRLIQISQWEFRIDIVGTPIPPIPPQNDTSDGVRKSHHKYQEEKEKQDKERQRINQLLQEEEIISMVLQTFTKIVNNI